MTVPGPSGGLDPACSSMVATRSTAADSRKPSAPALAASRDSTSARKAASPAQAASKYFWRSSTMVNARAFKNRSFAWGFQVVIVGVRLGVTALLINARKEGGLRAKKTRTSQLFRQLAEQPSPAKRPEAVGRAAADA